MKKALLALRIALGWLFVYAGATKILNPEWSAAGYLKGASTFQGMYEWFASPANIGWVNFVNEWGLLVIGILLILGLWVRYASIGGIVLMALYYLPILKFPIVGEHSFIVDEHIIYIIAFCLFITTNAGRYMGLDGRFHRN